MEFESIIVNIKLIAEDINNINKWRKVTADLNLNTDERN